LKRNDSVTQSVGKVVTKFPYGVVPIALSISKEAFYVAGYSQFTERGHGLMVIDILPLIV